MINAHRIDQSFSKFRRIGYRYTSRWSDNCAIVKYDLKIEIGTVGVAV